MMVGRMEGRCNIFDLHVIHTIANGIKYYAQNQTAFNNIFNQTSVAIKNKYFTRLQTLVNEVQVDVAFTKKSEKFPLVSVSLSEARIEDTTFLGNTGHGGRLTQLSNQECRINIFAKDMNDIRILHQIIIASLLLFKKSFFDVSYLDIRYLQSKDLEPIEMLTSDNVLVLNRELIYMSTYQLEIAPVQDPNSFDLPWKLNASVEEF